MNLLKKAGDLLATAALIALGAGCGTTNTGTFPTGVGQDPPPPPQESSAFNVGDMVLVTFSGVDTPPQAHEERVKEDGTVTFSLIGSVVAKGKTAGELQAEIRSKYVPYYFKESLNVTVKTQERYFFVGGEVKGAARYPWSEGMTVVKAIQTAGYFTDFAKRSKVRLTRVNGKTIVINYDKILENPALDLPVYPGDSINVPERGW